MSDIASQATNKIIDYASELLTEMVLTLEPLWGSSSAERQTKQVEEIIRKKKNNYSGLLDTAFEEAQKGNYFVAYKLFEEVRDEVKTPPSEKNRFAFYVLWSGVKCGYYLRGKPGQHILSITRDQVQQSRKLEAKEQKTLKGIGKKCPDAEKGKIEELLLKSKLRQFYLRYLEGLTFGLEIIPAEKTIPNYPRVDREYVIYQELLRDLDDCFKADEISSYRDWVQNLREEVEERKKRSGELQSFFFGRSWSRTPFQNVGIRDRLTKFQRR